MIKYLVCVSRGVVAESRESSIMNLLRAVKRFFGESSINGRLLLGGCCFLQVDKFRSVVGYTYVLLNFLDFCPMAFVTWNKLLLCVYRVILLSRERVRESR